MRYDERMDATCAIIAIDSLKRNIRAVRERVGGQRGICLPVKADAYGHGAAAIAAAALEAGVDCLGVARVQEGLELRNSGIAAPILVFSLPLVEELSLAIRHGLIPFLGDREFAEIAAGEAAQAGLPLRVHLKIDTGMSRGGCRPEEAPDLAAYVAAQPFLELAGSATHLAVSDSAAPADRAFTALQLTRFQEAVTQIRRRGIDPGILHAANSGGILYHPDSWLDMVRPGILIYGYPPADYAPEADELGGIAVEPIMELQTQIIAIKQIKKGDTVSYGRTWTAQEDTVIGIIPVGYGDGLTRALSGRFSVLIRGKRYPLAGRICMDQSMVDLGSATDIPRWERVTVFGRPGTGREAPYTAGDIAEILGTIPYEVCCGISKRVPRVYRDVEIP